MAVIINETNDMISVESYGEHSISPDYYYSPSKKHFYYYIESKERFTQLNERPYKDDDFVVQVNDIEGLWVTISHKIFLKKLNERLDIEPMTSATVDDWLRDAHEDLFGKAYTVKSVHYRFATAADVNTSLSLYKRNHPEFSFDGKIKDYLVGLGFQFLKTTLTFNNETRKGVPLYRIETARFNELIAQYDN